MGCIGSYNVFLSVTTNAPLSVGCGAKKSNFLAGHLRSAVRFHIVHVKNVGVTETERQATQCAHLLDSSCTANPRVEAYLKSSRLRCHMPKLKLRDSMQSLSIFHSNELSHIWDRQIHDFGDPTSEALMSSMDPWREIEVMRRVY